MYNGAKPEPRTIIDGFLLAAFNPKDYLLYGQIGLLSRGWRWRRLFERERGTVKLSSSVRVG